MHALLLFWGEVGWARENVGRRAAKGGQSRGELPQPQPPSTHDCTLALSWLCRPRRFHPSECMLAATNNCSQVGREGGHTGESRECNRASEAVHEAGQALSTHPPTYLPPTQHHLHHTHQPTITPTCIAAPPNRSRASDTFCWYSRQS